MVEEDDAATDTEDVLVGTIVCCVLGVLFVAGADVAGVDADGSEAGGA